jgi:hypothetical protein
VARGELLADALYAGSHFVPGVDPADICKQFCEAVVNFEEGAGMPPSLAPLHAVLISRSTAFPGHKIMGFITDAECNFKTAQNLIADWFLQNQNGRVMVLLVC